MDVQGSWESTVQSQLQNQKWRWNMLHMINHNFHQKYLLGNVLCATLHQLHLKFFDIDTMPRHERVIGVSVEPVITVNFGKFCKESIVGRLFEGGNVRIEIAILLHLSDFLSDSWEIQASVPVRSENYAGRFSWRWASWL